MPLLLNSRYVDNVYLLACQGRIVAGEEVRSLETALDLAAREFTRIVLQVSEIERLDSSGIGLLVRYSANMRKRGGDLRLAAAPKFVVDLLELTKLSSILKNYPSEDEAILSYLGERSSQAAPQSGGPRVLFLDPSADLCAFVRTLLQQHGFHVQSTNRLSDTKLLLRVEKVDYILLGPESAQLASASIVPSLKACAPSTQVLQLPVDFQCRDAQEAADALLQMIPQGK
jgi:anti-sigma B factor antagonist